MKIRKARLSDAEQISGLITRTIKKVNNKDYSKKEIDQWVKFNSIENIKKKLGKPDLGKYVIEENKNILGYGRVKKNSIGSLYVLSRFIRKGAGKKLLKFMEERIKKQGYRTTNVRSSITAFGFYKKQGYIRLRDGLNKTGNVRMRCIYMFKRI